MGDTISQHRPRLAVGVHRAHASSTEMRLRSPFTRARGNAKDGDPGGSRTPNPQIRSLMLYPVELRGHPRAGAIDQPG